MYINPENTVRSIFEEADIIFGGSEPSDPKVNNSRFYRRVLANGSLGLGESYVDGDWNCKDLDNFFCKLMSADLNKKAPKNTKTILEAILAKVRNFQDEENSKIVADIHYNLGSDFYASMLGQTMQYTCAYWKNSKDLDQAQLNKMNLVAKKLKLEPGMRVLELGSGFGTLAQHLSLNEGVQIEAYNISEDQVRFARKHNPHSKVKFHLEDYRKAQGSFDRVVSIGMMEHVGPKNYREFMEVINRNLKPEGLALVHTIGKDISSTTPSDPWIRKYIFPHGHIPSLTQIAEATEGLFTIEDVHNFGPDYDRTLMAWHTNATNNWEIMQSTCPQAKDLRFKRKWDYYLLSCAGAFRSRKLQLFQTVLSKDRKERYDSIR